jgi:hypothetical protein
MPEISAETQRPLPVVTETAKQTPGRKPVGPPKQHLAGKAITGGSAEAQKGAMPWIIGGLVLVLMGIFTATLLRRRQPQTETPEPPETPAPLEAPVTEEIRALEQEPEPIKVEEPMEEPKPSEEPKPIAVEKPKPKPKPEPPKLIYKPVKGKPVKEAPLNKYEAEVRKKLAKAIKKRRR